MTSRSFWKSTPPPFTCASVGRGSGWRNDSRNKEQSKYHEREPSQKRCRSGTDVVLPVRDAEPLAGMAGAGNPRGAPAPLALAVADALRGGGVAGRAARGVPGARGLLPARIVRQAARR